MKFYIILFSDGALLAIALFFVYLLCTTLPNYLMAIAEICTPAFKVAELYMMSNPIQTIS